MRPLVLFIFFKCSVQLRVVEVSEHEVVVFNVQSMGSNSVPNNSLLRLLVKYLLNLRCCDKPVTIGVLNREAQVIASSIAGSLSIKWSNIFDPCECPVTFLWR